jgi:hypothetical protein
MYGGQIYAYGVRVPEVPFDKPHLTNPSNPLAPPLPPQPTTQYSPNSPRSSQEASKSPQGQQTPFPPGTESYPHMLQAVSYLYDYIVKASNPVIQQQPPQQQQQQQQQPQPQQQQQQQQPVTGYAMQQNHYQPQPQPQPWVETKAIGAPAALGFSPYYNGNWGWGGPPGAV